MTRKAKLIFILRLIFVLLLILLSAKIFLKGDYFFTFLIIICLICYQIFKIFRIIDVTNKDLNAFLISIEHMDFSSNFHLSESDNSYSTLLKTFDRILLKFRHLRRENEEQRLFLLAIIKNLKIGLIIYENDSISVINNYAKKILNITKITKFSDLYKNIPGLESNINKTPGGTPFSLIIGSDDEKKHLSIINSTIEQKGKLINILSIHDIQFELDKKEIESWQKLISVLTHEIMNSMTPIASMGSSSSIILNDIPEEVRNKYNEQFEDIKDSLETISKRSKGLIHFVKSYRDLTKIPKPVLSLTLLLGTVNDVIKLYDRTIMEEGIQLIINFVDQKVVSKLDKKLFEQVLINILKNAIDALADSEIKRIWISQEFDHNGKIMLTIRDTGPGIEEDALEKIFIPFFTTKRNGTGIGLSLSRQIIGMLGGSLSIKNNINSGITVTIKI